MTAIRLHRAGAARLSVAEFRQDACLINKFIAISKGREQKEKESHGPVSSFLMSPWSDNVQKIFTGLGHGEKKFP